jgi:DNA helicase IV
MTIDTILDKHIDGFQKKVDISNTRMLDINTELIQFNQEKAGLDVTKANNKKLEDQINVIKQQIMTIDVKNIGDTQRYLESVKHDVIHISKDKYDNLTDSIDRLQKSLNDEEEALNIINDKLNRYTKAKQTLGLSD